MGISPRTLRPSSNFSPRSISGLALWLDGSDTASLYTTDAGPVTAVSDPRDIAGCQLWLDASDPASITASGGEVSQWTDKSATGSTWTVPSGFGGPTTGSATMGGKNALLFDGVNDVLKSSANPLGAALPLTFFLVQRIIAPTGFGTSYVIIPSTRVIIRQVSTFGWVDGFVGGLSDSTNRLFRDQRDRTGANDIYTMVFPSGAGTTNTAVANGAGLATTNSTLKPDVQGNHYIGCRLAFDTTPEQFANIAVAEIVAYNTALSTADRARVEAYLAAKWSIAGVHAPATASSDPVGYWGDKSGNGRHAVMSVSANRPTVGSSSTAGKNAVRNNGTGTVALQVAAWPYTAGNTQFAVFNASAINQGIYQRGSLNDEPRMAIQGGTIPAVNATRGGSSAAQTSSVVGYPLSQWAIGATLFNTSLGRAYRDGVYGADTTDSQTFSGDQELRLLSLPTNIYGINGGIAEFLYYDRQLTATEVSRVAAYLSRRWGITLAPTVANADAQDWVNRVYANGGTVSTATAGAVNTFCESIASAGIRSKMLRLNLFCGTGLNACLTPLYRAASLGDTQLGNATDTNVGPFVSGDFADATGLAAGSGKYLRTGLTQVSVGVACHLAFYDCAKATSGYGNRIGSRGASGANEHLMTNLDVSTTIDYGSSAVSGNHRARATGYTESGAFWMGVNPTSASAILYKNGVSAATATPSARTAQSLEYYVFALNSNGSLADPTTTGRSGGYSIGTAMDATEASAYNTAMQAFQAALTRNA